MACDEKADPGRIGGEADGLKWPWVAVGSTIIAAAEGKIAFGPFYVEMELWASRDRGGFVGSVRFNDKKIAENIRPVPTCLEAQLWVETTVAELGRALIATGDAMEREYVEPEAGPVKPTNKQTEFCPSCASTDVDINVGLDEEAMWSCRHCDQRWPCV